MSSVRLGAPPGQARAAVVLVHGRGSNPEDMLGLAEALDRQLRAGSADRTGLAWLALRAPSGSWYPYGFMEPIEANQPALDAALAAVATAVGELTAEGLSHRRLALLGFSQGACLSMEYAARNARRFGAVVGLSGGLIGPDGTPRDYEGSLSETPVFVGCSDVDPHIPVARVRESAEILAGLEGVVKLRIYPDMGHTVNQDEIDTIVSMIGELL